MGNALDGGIVEQTTAGVANDAFALGLWGHGHLQHHVEAANESGIHAHERVADPKGGQLVGFEQAVDPAFGLAGGALEHVAELGVVVIGAVESVFDFVKHDERLTSRKQAVRGAEGFDAFAPRDGFLVFVFGGDFEQLATHVFGQEFGKLGFAGAGWAIEQHVHAALALVKRLAQVGAQHLQRFAAVGVVFKVQVAWAAGHDHVLEPVGGLQIVIDQAVGQFFGKQVEFDVQRMVGLHIHNDQARFGQHPPTAQSLANGHRVLVKDGGHDLVQALVVQVFDMRSGLVQVDVAFHQHGELQHAALDIGQPDECGDACHVARQGGGHLHLVGAPFGLNQQAGQGDADFDLRGMFFFAFVIVGHGGNQPEPAGQVGVLKPVACDEKPVAFEQDQDAQDPQPNDAVVGVCWRCVAGWGGCAQACFGGHVFLLGVRKRFSGSGRQLVSRCVAKRS